jgi:hypothetical protein
LLPNAGHNILFTLCQLWSRSYPIKLHFLIFRIQYSIEGTSVDIGDMSTLQCALYSTFAVKYRAQYPVCAMPSLMPVKSNIITFLDTQSTIFNLTYLFRYWSHVDNSMRVILLICSQIHSTISGLSYAISGPGKNQYIYISCYSGFKIKLNVSLLLLVASRQIYARILHIICQIQSTISCLRSVKSGSRQMQYNYSSSYAGFNIQLNVPPQRLVDYRQIDARYTPHLLRYTEHNIGITLCQLWSRSNAIELQFMSFRLQCSIERIWVAIGGVSTNPSALYSTFAAK